MASPEAQNNVELLADQLESFFDISTERVEIFGDWILVTSPDPLEFAHRAAKVPGVMKTFVGTRLPLDGSKLLEHTVSVSKKYVPHGFTFTVKVLGRGNIEDADLSNYVTSKLVEIMHERRAIPSDSSPGVTIWVFRGDDLLFISPLGIPGTGGVPSGLAGGCAVMFSGGVGSTLAALEVNRAGFGPMLCHGLVEPASPSSLRMVALSATFVRRSVPLKDFKLHVFCLPKLQISGSETDLHCVQYALLAECTSMLGRKQGAVAVSAGLTSKHSNSGLIRLFAKHSNDLETIYPLLSRSSSEYAHFLPSELLKRESYVKIEETLNCEVSCVETLFRKLHLPRSAAEAVANSVAVPLHSTSSYHQTLDGIVSALKAAGVGGVAGIQ